MAQKAGRAAADQVLAAGLAAGLSTEQAAEQAGVSLRTAWRRKADPAFAALVHSLRQEMVTRTTGRLVNASGNAVSTLEALTAAEFPPAIRLAAAKALLEIGPKWRETADLGEQVQQLRQQLEERSR